INLSFLPAEEELLSAKIVDRCLFSAKSFWQFRFKCCHKLLFDASFFIFNLDSRNVRNDIGFAFFQCTIESIPQHSNRHRSSFYLIALKPSSEHAQWGFTITKHNPKGVRLDAMCSQSR